MVEHSVATRPKSPGQRVYPPSRVGQHVAIGMATERSATTRPKHSPCSSGGICANRGQPTALLVQCPPWGNTAVLTRLQTPRSKKLALIGASLKQHGPPRGGREDTARAVAAATAVERT